MMDRLVTPCGALPCMLCVLTNETKEEETALMFVLFQHRMASVRKGGKSLLAKARGAPLTQRCHRLQTGPPMMEASALLSSYLN